MAWLGWLGKLQKSWENYVGDRDLELGIRSYLTKNGFRGQSAELRGVRLVAIQRPGWLQIYRFEATAMPKEEGCPAPSGMNRGRLPNAPRQIYGLVRSDERYTTSIRIFEDPRLRQSLFRQWSDGLICLRGSQGLG